MRHKQTILILFFSLIFIKNSVAYENLALESSLKRLSGKTGTSLPGSPKRSERPRSLTNTDHIETPNMFLLRLGMILGENGLRKNELKKKIKELRQCLKEVYPTLTNEKQRLDVKNFLIKKLERQYEHNGLNLSYYLFDLIDELTDDWEEQKNKILNDAIRKNSLSRIEFGLIKRNLLLYFEYLHNNKQMNRINFLAMADFINCINEAYKIEDKEKQEIEVVSLVVEITGFDKNDQFYLFATNFRRFYSYLMENEEHFKIGQYKQLKWLLKILNATLKLILHRNSMKMIERLSVNVHESDFLAKGIERGLIGLLIENNYLKTITGKPYEYLVLKIYPNRWLDTLGEDKKTSILDVLQEAKNKRIAEPDVFSFVAEDKLKQIRIYSNFYANYLILEKYFKINNKYKEKKEKILKELERLDLNVNYAYFSFHIRKNKIKQIVNFWKKFYALSEKQKDRVLNKKKSVIRYRVDNSSGNKIFIIPDIHGDFHQILYPLISAGIIDLTGELLYYNARDKRYISEQESKLMIDDELNDNVFIIPKVNIKNNPKDRDNIVVFLGDVLDRGKYSEECLAFLRYLLRECLSKDDHRVKIQMGNHDLNPFFNDGITLGPNNYNWDYHRFNGGQFKPLHRPVHLEHVKSMFIDLLEEIWNENGNQIKLVYQNSGILFAHSFLTNDFFLKFVGPNPDPKLISKLPDVDKKFLRNIDITNDFSSIDLEKIVKIINKLYKDEFLKLKKEIQQGKTISCDNYYFLYTLLLCDEISILNARDQIHKGKNKPFAHIQSASGHIIFDKSSCYRLSGNGNRGEIFPGVGFFDLGASYWFVNNMHFNSAPCFSVLDTTDGSVIDFSIKNSELPSDYFFYGDIDNSENITRSKLLEINGLSDYLADNIIAELIKELYIKPINGLSDEYRVLKTGFKSKTLTLTQNQIEKINYLLKEAQPLFQFQEKIMDKNKVDETLNHAQQRDINLNIGA